MCRRKKIQNRKRKERREREPRIPRATLVSLAETQAQNIPQQQSKVTPMVSKWCYPQQAHKSPGCPYGSSDSNHKQLIRIDLPESHETLAPGHILRYYEDFKEVFSKEKAGHIPEHRAWDCAIDLLPNTTPLKAKFTLSHCQRQKPCLPHRSIHSISEHYQAMRLVEKLMAAEVNYDVGNQELLSIKATLEEWQHWLEGARHPFLVLTDHHNL
ncbi:hypothetical protein QTP86_004971 [Hemibagrus guttatus]|nr:hypothetical protein QTP86_004971 [Hemibagrus guttatus]